MYKLVHTIAQAKKFSLLLKSQISNLVILLNHNKSYTRSHVEVVSILIHIWELLHSNFSPKITSCAFAQSFLINVGIIV